MFDICIVGRIGGQNPGVGKFEGLALKVGRDAICTFIM